jgi:hypothetical protein
MCRALPEVGGVREDTEVEGAEYSGSSKGVCLGAGRSGEGGDGGGEDRGVVTGYQ